ncbi:MAG: hypothetical protein AAFN50_05600 [Pseudomonadota bacterium]
MSTSGDTAILIGSSPLMLLLAIKLSESHRVTLISDQSTLGGAWKTASVKNSPDVEIACHVIEPFPGVYELLAKRSGVPFDDLDLQPIRVHPSGLKVRYFSRLTLALSLAYMSVMLVYYRGKSVFVAGRYKDDVANFSVKLRGLLRHQWTYLIKKAAMKGPRGGYARFLQGLIDQCRKAGVSFVQDRVTAIERIGHSWHVSSASGTQFTAHSIHSSSSVPLLAATESRFETETPRIVSRTSVLVDIPKQDVTNQYTYVAFWRNPMVRRLSRVESVTVPPDTSRFLFELGKQFDNVNQDLVDHLQYAAKKANLTTEIDARMIVDLVDCSTALPGNQLEPGEAETEFFTYYSFGNLAAGIATHMADLESLDMTTS